MPPKLTKKEAEALVKRRLAHKIYNRRRYNEIKNDPDLLEIERKRRREQYLKKKETKKAKSAREQKEQRKKWRENSKRYREKKKEKSTAVKDCLLQTVNIPAVVNENGSNLPKNEAEKDTRVDPLHHCPYIQSEVNKVRYEELKRRKRLLRTIAAYRKKTKTQQRQILRLQQKLIELKADIEPQDSTKISQLDEDVVIDSDHEKETPLIELVKKFYTEDGNSVIAAGKKEFITRNKVCRQKRYLCLPIKDLYKRFRSETKVRISYSFFSKLRPFWVLFPKKSNRETCQCAVHVNMELLISGLNKALILKEKNSHQVLSKLCCNVKNIHCLQRKCDTCRYNRLEYNNESKNKNVNYFQWVKVTKGIVLKNGSKKKQIVSEKKILTARFTEAVAKMEHDLKTYFEHVYKIVGQYKTITNLKENLNIQECLIHVDFSENYSLKYSEEVQSFHFGGSRQQVSLHTAVAYVHDFDTGLVTPSSICTVSDCLRHDAPAIWAHLVPLIEEVIKLNPLIDTIHFLSDSPSSQYRNKNMFYVISQIYSDFPGLNKITWNFSEAGHGKGAPDGVGATLKRTADRMVLYGEDVGTFDQFYNLIKGCIKADQLKIKVKKIEEQHVTQKSDLISNSIKPFRGTFCVHQVLWDKSQTKLTLRKMSCFECSASQICEHGHHLGHIVNLNASTLKCPGLPSTSKVSKKIEVLSDISLNLMNSKNKINYKISNTEKNPKTIKIMNK